MKTRTIFLVMAIFALCRPADADWRIDQSKYLRYLRTVGYDGNGAEQGPCKYATKIECQNAIKEYARQMGDPHFASMAECVECGGSGGNSGGSPEQQMAQGLANFFVNLIFPPKRDTSRQDEIERQNAIKLKQAEEQKKQAAMQAANQAWIDLQNIEKEKRKFDDAKKLAAGEDLLAKIDTVGGGELKLKTIGTDFNTENNNLESKLEQDEFENMNAAWMEKQRKLIQQRTEEPNKWCSAIYESLKTNVPPPPSYKNFNELQPGDVLLIEGEGVSKGIAWVDNKSTYEGLGSSASHTVIYLKEVNGKKLFLDNQPGQGPHIISEAEFLEEYGHRGAEVARLVGQPLNEEEGRKLFHAAVEMAQKNRKEIANNMFGSRFLGTNYGALGDDRVCSEADWALINATGRTIPRSGDQTKVKWGVDFSPADFQNQRYFLITPLVMPK